MSLVTDTFTDAVNQLLESHTANTGQTWSKSVSSDAGALRIGVVNANELSPDSNGVRLMYVVNETPPSADYEVSLDVIVGSTSATAHSGVMARHDPTLASGNGYSFFVDTLDNPSFTQFLLVKDSPTGGQTQVLGSYALADTTGTFTIKLRVQGSTISGFVNGVQQVTVTDTEFSAAGLAGIRGLNFVSISQTMDNFDLSTIAGGSILKGFYYAQTQGLL